MPFLPQVPPGDWVNTRNCGPACAVMMRAYYFNIQPSPDHIIQADNWLNAHFGLPVNGYNGDWTNIFQVRAWLDSEGVPTKVGMGNLEQARAMLSEGKPFLVAVYSNMNPNGGAKHAMLVAVSYTHLDVYKRQLLFLLILTLVLHFFFTPGEYIWEYGFLHISREMCIRDRYFPSCDCSGSLAFKREGF